MHLIIDNYDSFTYNIAQYLSMLGVEVEVRRNDEVTLDQIEALAPQSIVISPGPCSPTEAGISNDVIRRFASRVPLLGVCLGHQCMSFAFGGRVRRAERIFHGKSSLIRHDGSDLFVGLPSTTRVARYHSLVVDDLPPEFVVTSRVLNDDGSEGEIMSMQHRDLPIYGVQFHPESVLTDHGIRLCANYLRLVERHASAVTA
jgi:anthranilate synthase component 2